MVTWYQGKTLTKVGWRFRRSSRLGPGFVCLRFPCAVCRHFKSQLKLSPSESTSAYSPRVLTENIVTGCMGSVGRGHRTAFMAALLTSCWTFDTHEKNVKWSSPRWKKEFLCIIHEVAVHVQCSTEANIHILLVLSPTCRAVFDLTSQSLKKDYRVNISVKAAIKRIEFEWNRRHKTLSVPRRASLPSKTWLIPVHPKRRKMRSASSISSHTRETAMSHPAMDTSRCQTQHQGELIHACSARDDRNLNHEGVNCIASTHELRCNRRIYSDCIQCRLAWLEVEHRK